MNTTGAAEPPPLRAAALRLGYRDHIVIDDLTLTLPAHQITVIVGGNACGKSTLLRGLARLLTPRAGAVYLDGHAISRLPTHEVARRVGVLPQSPTTPDGITVEDLVARGRYPHQRWWRHWSAADARAVRQALAATSLLHLAQTPVDELSGGQRQRAWIAMALAQQTPVLLLDEPTTHLDLAHQVEVLDLISDLNAEQDRTIVMVLHDLNLAARYAHHLIAMRDGQVVAAGPPARIITTDLVHNLFGLPARILADPVTGTPLVIPVTRRHRREEGRRCGTSVPQGDQKAPRRS